MKKGGSDFWDGIGQPILIIAFIAVLILFAKSGDKKAEKARQEAYNEGYTEAVNYYEDKVSDAYKEGYGDAMSYYGVEDYHTVHCPHCGVYIWVDVFGNDDGYDWG